METTRKCNKCLQIKSVSDFYPTVKRRRCKSCVKEYIRHYYSTHKHLIRPEQKKRNIEVLKRYRQTKEGKAAVVRASLRARERYPEKFRTRYLSKELVRKGVMAQLACEACGNFLSEAHHPDYSNPYLVVWLCRKHHREIESLFSQN